MGDFFRIGRSNRSNLIGWSGFLGGYDVEGYAEEDYALDVMAHGFYFYARHAGLVDDEVDAVEGEVLCGDDEWVAAVCECAADGVAGAWGAAGVDDGEAAAGGCDWGGVVAAGYLAVGVVGGVVGAFEEEYAACLGAFYPDVVVWVALIEQSLEHVALAYVAVLRYGGVAVVFGLLCLSDGAV